MRQSYLTACLAEMQGASRTYPRGLDAAETRGLTVRLEIYDIYSVERLAAHLGLSPERFAASVLAGALSEAVEYFADDLRSSFEDDGDAYIDAWTTSRASQDLIASLLAGWRSLHLETKSVAQLDHAQPEPAAGIARSGAEQPEPAAGDEQPEPAA